ncbi:MAG: glycyl-radical enzyme activating protein [Spirochaetales bacterium]|nr:glycyl-radical enzyme activating protein [Spirochaetales bacterium]
MATNAAPQGLVFDIKRFAVHDGPGVRTTVFLKGCGLSCIWCHNPESINPEPELIVLPKKCIGCGACVEACPNHAHTIGENGEHLFDRKLCTACGRCAEVCYAQALVLAGRWMSIDEVAAVLEEDRKFFEISKGGVTLSGGEPFVQHEFTSALLRRCKEEGFHTAVDTSGAVAWNILEQSLPYIDLILYDIKQMDPGAHERLTGRSNELSLENLRRLDQAGAAIEIRMPVIPTLNDDPDNIAAAGQFIAGLDNVVAVKLLPYHNFAGTKYDSVGRTNTLPVVEPPSQAEMVSLAKRIREIAAQGPLPGVEKEKRLVVVAGNEMIR